jgi:predicted nucleic acid-binding protein
MKIIVDTPIWSYAFRSNRDGFELYVKELETLISDQRVLIIGSIRQEVLAGYSDIKKFEKLDEKLKYFENTPIIDDDYIHSARFANICRTKGMQGSNTDFLIYSVASRLQAKIFTKDNDFGYYEKYVPIQLFNPSSQG